MAELTIPASWTCDVDVNTKYDCDGSDEISAGIRIAQKFPLTTLPSGANVTKVESKVYVSVNVSGFLINIHPYNEDGQADPYDDNPLTMYNRCLPSAIYIDGDTFGQTTGWHTITLGDGESAQACVDVEAAKSAVDRFTVSFVRKSGSNFVHLDEYCMANKPQLIITYTTGGGLSIPVAMHHYNRINKIIRG
jgi:hypothetical protein